MSIIRTFTDGISLPSLAVGQPLGATAAAATAEAVDTSQPWWRSASGWVGDLIGDTTKNVGGVVDAVVDIKVTDWLTDFRNSLLPPPAVVRGVNGTVDESPNTTAAPDRSKYMLYAVGGVAAIGGLFLLLK